MEYLFPSFHFQSVSLGLKWVSCRQHLYRSCFCIHSASLCLLVEAFNQFTFKIIIFYFFYKLTYDFKAPWIIISFFFSNLFIYLFIYFIFILGCVGSSFLCEGFLQLWQAGATLHRGVLASSLSRPLLLRSTGSRRAGSVVVAHGPSCSEACWIFPDQGPNSCPLH